MKPDLDKLEAEAKKAIVNTYGDAALDPEGAAFWCQKGIEGMRYAIANAAVDLEAGGARFDHDCESCTYLGQLGRYDIYSCPQSGIPTIVARFSDAGADYVSGPTVSLVIGEERFRLERWKQ